MLSTRRLLFNLIILVVLPAGLLCCTSNRIAVTEQRTINSLVAITVPASFSPDGDGINDTWKIEGLSAFSSAEINLYTRYGQLVYCSKGLYREWDGLYKNKRVPAGNYYYVIKKSRKAKVIDGWMAIVR